MPPAFSQTGSVQGLVVAVPSRQEAALWTHSIFSALARLATCCLYPWGSPPALPRAVQTRQQVLRRQRCPQPPRWRGAFAAAGVPRSSLSAGLRYQPGPGHSRHNPREEGGWGSGEAAGPPLGGEREEGKDLAEAAPTLQSQTCWQLRPCSDSGPWQTGDCCWDVLLLPGALLPLVQPWHTASGDPVEMAGDQLPPMGNDIIEPLNGLG